MILEIEVFEGEGGGLVHAEAVVVDHGEERPVSR